MAQPDPQSVLPIKAGRSSCPINMGVELLGDRWSFVVLRDIMFGGRRHFRELLTNSLEGIASNIFASRLDRLVRSGLLTRHDDPTHRQKIEYRLTDAAIELVPVMAALGEWGTRWLPTSAELSARARLLSIAKHGKLIWSTMMSLDCFVADSDEAMDWVFGFDNTAGSSVPDLVDRLGALLVGRRTMDVEDPNQPGFYGGAYTGPFFVLTRESDRATPIVNGVTETVLNRPIDDAVHQALEAAAGGDVAILGSTVARACLDADFVGNILGP